MILDRYHSVGIVASWTYSGLFHGQDSLVTFRNASVELHINCCNVLKPVASFKVQHHSRGGPVENACTRQPDLTLGLGFEYSLKL
jgi:hypothetical protein